jgi:hypothetical protein
MSGMSIEGFIGFLSHFTGLRQVLVATKRWVLFPLYPTNVSLLQSLLLHA